MLAVGNPFGLGGTVSSGIISARGRDIHDGPYDDFLQIDASINRGNSGGPTFDLEGKVIGINTAIYSPNGGSVGIGFAIPSSLAQPVIDQLKEHGKVERGWLGVQIQEVTPEIAKSLGLPKPEGALVADVTKDGPAQKIGIQQGDVILSFDGHDVATAARPAARRRRDARRRDREGQDLARRQRGDAVARRRRDAGEPAGWRRTRRRAASRRPRDGQIGLQLAPLTRDWRSRRVPESVKAWW